MNDYLHPPRPGILPAAARPAARIPAPIRTWEDEWWREAWELLAGYVEETS